MLVIRYNIDLKTSKVMLRTGEQQHNFNAPFQLANIPHGLKPTSDGAEDTKRKFWKDKVSDSVIYQTNIQEGDIIIGGTDGLFDNLYSHEIINIIDVFMNDCLASSSEDSLPSVNTHSLTPVLSQSHLAMLTKRNAKLLAHDLVREAKRKSKSKGCSTPFADRFNKSKIKKDQNLVWKGGKPDDI